jgi:hypothetical protein
MTKQSTRTTERDERLLQLILTRRAPFARASRQTQRQPSTRRKHRRHHPRRLDAKSYARIHRIAHRLFIPPRLRRPIARRQRRIDAFQRLSRRRRRCAIDSSSVRFTPFRASQPPTERAQTPLELFSRALAFLRRRRHVPSVRFGSVRFGSVGQSVSSSATVRDAERIVHRHGAPTAARERRSTR